MLDDIDQKSLREIIRRNTRLALERLGWNQADLARDLGVVRQRVNYILGSASYKPTLIHIVQISRALGISIDWPIDPEATWPPADRPTQIPRPTPMTSEPTANLTAAQRVLLDVVRLVEAESGEDPEKLKISIAILSAKRP